MANTVAPEHLQLMVPEETGLDMLDGVQNAGAVFIGDWAPASLGDYIAGPNHVLPTNRTARFSSALRADDFRKHMHAVTATPEAMRCARPPGAGAGRDRGAPGPRRLGAAAPGCPRSGGPAVSAVPPVRPDLDLGEGYHSPQVEAEVRLNTNESPFAPPDEWRQELLDALADVSFHRYPDRPAPELRQALADLHGVTPEEIFCANGSNEVLQSLLLAFGGPGRRALVFEPTYALHSHIARITGTEVVEGGRDDDFLIDPSDALGVARVERARGDLPVLAEQPDRAGGAPGDGRGGGGRRARGWWSWTRPTGSSRPGALLALRGSGPARARGDAHVLEDVGAGRAPAWATWWPTRPWSWPARPSSCRTTCPCRPSWPGCWRCATCPRWRRGWPASPKSGAGWRRAWPTCPWTAGPRTRTSSCSGRASATPDDVWRALLDRSILIRNCASWDGLKGCLRVTIGTPEENERFLHALKESL